MSKNAVVTCPLAIGNGKFFIRDIVRMFEMTRNTLYESCQ